MSAKVLVSSDRSTHIVVLGWEGAIASRAASDFGELDFEQNIVGWQYLQQMLYLVHRSLTAAPC